MAVAMLGAVAGAMGFIFTGGDKATADKIWAPAMGGEYVITPRSTSAGTRIYISSDKPIASKTCRHQGAPPFIHD